MKDDFERFGNYLFIDVMRSSISNTTLFYSIAQVVLNEIRRVNIFCEGFVITENHDAYTFILESLFQMSSTRSNENLHTIYADAFMTKNILDSSGIQNTRIFYDHFYSKLNLEKALISKWNILSSIQCLLTVIHIENTDGSFYFPDDSIVLKNRQKFCSCYIINFKFDAM